MYATSRTAALIPNIFISSSFFTTTEGERNIIIPKKKKIMINEENISTKRSEYEQDDKEDGVNDDNNSEGAEQVAVQKEFIRKLANDYLHYKIYGTQPNNLPNGNAEFQNENPANPPRPRQRRRNTAPQNVVIAADGDANNNTESSTDRMTVSKNTIPFRKTAKILRKVSVEIERNNEQFFNSVCGTLNLDEGNPERAFKAVSEEVLSLDSLNWGRVVSLFTFGGKLAEWFWRTQQEERIEELEGWLTESISNKEEWIEKQGGWETFNETFGETSDQNEEQFDWWRPGLLVCMGVSIAAVFTIKMQ